MNYAFKRQQLLSTLHLYLYYLNTLPKIPAFNTLQQSFHSKTTTKTMASSPASDEHNPSPPPRIDSIQTIASTKWLSLQTLSYTDEKNNERKWDMAVRTTKKDSRKADAVVIIPILYHSSSSSSSSNTKNTNNNTKNLIDMETILVEQYRPPCNCKTLEFPAGLIDEHESAEQAALRELKEETGFIGVPRLPISPILCMSPGLTNESIQIVVVDVDLDDERNLNPEQSLDPGEIITVKRLSLNEGFQLMFNQKHESNKESTIMPISMLYTFILGLDMGSKML